MKIQTQFTSEEILREVEKGDFFLFDDSFNCCGYVDYKLTESEQQWMEFVRNRYSIYDYIIDNTNEEGITRFYSEEFSKALDDDCGGAGKAACLIDTSALQTIFFYGYKEQ